MRVAFTPPLVRPRLGSRRRGVPRPDGLERRRRARARRVLRGAAADAEGARDRAARRAAARARGLPAADRARARRARPRRAAPLPLRGEGRDRAGGAHVARRLRRRAGIPYAPTTASRPRRCSTPSSTADASRRTSSSCSASRRGTPRVGEGDRRPRAAGRGGARPSARSASRRAAIPGQEPIARLHYRGHANRGLRVLDARRQLPAPDAELAYEGKSVGRVTSAAPTGDGAVALAYVRREVPEDAELRPAGAGTPLH